MEVNLLIKESSIHYDRFEADKLLKKIELFIDDLSNWYIRRNRRRFWKSENDTDKFVAYQTLYDVLLSLIKLLSPILPFITERMYLNISQDDPHENHDSIHLSSNAKHRFSLPVKSPVLSKLTDQTELLSLLASDKELSSVHCEK